MLTMGYNHRLTWFNTKGVLHMKPARSRISWNGDLDIWGLLYTTPFKRILPFKLNFWKKYRHFFLGLCVKKEKKFPSFSLHTFEKLHIWLWEELYNL